MLFDGDASVDKLADGMSGLGDLARDTGAQIQSSKLNILSSLAIAAAEIAYELAMADWTFGASLAWIPVVEAITIAAIKAVLARLWRRLVAALAQAFTKTGVDQDSGYGLGGGLGGDGDLAGSGVGHRWLSEGRRAHRQDQGRWTWSMPGWVGAWWCGWWAHSWVHP